MTDEFYMSLALDLAGTTKQQTSPNPAVGAVIVSNGEIVGLGAHLKAGGPHAEIHALRMAGSQANGSTVYVTLEPCSHYGKTPPCANALIEAGVSRVVIAAQDPNPLVAGKGLQLLRDAGIEVTTDILLERAQALNKEFFAYIQQRKPFVTLKQAITLDGKIAAKRGIGEQITSEESQVDVHKDRENHDAILVGIGTVCSDNPRLTNRLGNTKKQPIRIILDTHLRITPDRLVIMDSSAPTWIVTGSKASAEKIAQLSQISHVKILQLTKPLIDIEELLLELGKRQIMKLYVEGGQTVNASFLKSGSVNQLITYIAPKIVGGKNAIPMFSDLGVTQMEDALELELQEIHKIGEDLKIVSVLK
ncbi:bifunctional diaminohydroxyphosphoribosylaminopyrimidine deaminase/5-amino-6-(5-phosphoribosylamino)uracil reductase RibD [Rummeliibacillus sp. G93]|uniref:bifunctional diaminohydroxyphosphoribosylaminopyrimidine deaminase/5-amino-6-(5-phosphoribosylamino)uracil reductase RibD n=1 Tax=Rummeliibacillus sp. G93 TaxID=2939494 RepID=UPI00201BD0A5|nr:bifunctional diaminohydroxyphosphoribosylaminopyrimidine deaminase/5-amino-6-(5-phosphoribosylamino)uracil reductase RibD [Rummeliibacillus sp. G93]UQW97213.1 bifunctional diaminohydroxyphosphoribosylaminopyrimidine deaminase/5-amino-6-(5-phosphoribosylamino)uracil reductase RibD [Rummeliibacillus sp. G93]